MCVVMRARASCDDFQCFDCELIKCSSVDLISSQSLPYWVLGPLGEQSATHKDISKRGMTRADRVAAVARVLSEEVFDNIDTE